MNNSQITHAMLLPDATNADIHRVVTNAMQSGIGAAMLPPVWTARAATMLRGSGVHLCSTVSFPHGTSKSTVKAIEATSTIKDGADEIAIVPHVLNFLRQDIDAARYELLEIVRAARAARRDVIIKVILDNETFLQLPADQRESAFQIAAQAVRESACDGILTRTAEAVALFKKHSNDLFLDVFCQNTQAATPDSFLAAGADRVTIIL
jgi:deoxyribose-phosphate aldolase